MKRCNSCGVEKPLEDFRRQASTKSGRQSQCKKCANARLDVWRARTREHRLAYNRTYYASVKGREVVRRYQAKKPAKKAAQTAANRAIERGDLIRPDICQGCFKPRRVEAHHDDYARPLVVRWLCRGCHKSWHRINGEAKNADMAVPPRESRARMLERKAARLRLIPNMLAGGMTQKAIAKAFGVSQWTICYEVKRINSASV